MAHYTKETQHAEETIAFGRKVAQYVQKGMVIRLDGDLGAGKTTFTKGLAEGLGISRYIKSPSYTIIREYLEGDLPLYHIDLYRLDENSVEELGIDDYLYGDGLTVIEWGSVAEDSMPDNYLRICFERDIDNINKRTLTVEAVGEGYDELLARL